MNVDLIPRSQLATRLDQGWRLIPGHSYRPSDWAILMAHDDEPERNPQAVMLLFNPPKNKPRRCIRGHLIALAKPCKVCSRARDMHRYWARRAAQK